MVSSSTRYAPFDVLREAETHAAVERRLRRPRPTASRSRTRARFGTYSPSASAFTPYGSRCGDDPAGLIRRDLVVAVTLYVESIDPFGVQPFTS